ncbi:MAG: hypothetical protein AAB909_03000 [Patescibacteria group bacterium]
MANFQVSPKYITVDGPDGVGTSTVGAALKAELEAQAKKVFLIEVPHEITSLEQRELDRISDQSSPEVNLGYLTVTARVYTDQIIPALSSYDFVIAVGSELKNLFWAILDGNQTTVFAEIQTGEATHNLLPFLRILVTAPSETISENLSKRKNLSAVDPRPEELQKIQSRIDASIQAANLLAGLHPNSRLEIVHNHPPVPPTLPRV